MQEVTQGTDNICISTLYRVINSIIEKHFAGNIFSQYLSKEKYGDVSVVIQFLFDIVPGPEICSGVFETS